MKRFLVLVACCLVLGGCGNNGVSQEEYDKVVAERDKFQKDYEEMREMYAELKAKETIENVKREAGITSDQIPEKEKDESSSKTNESSDEFPFDYYPSGQYKVGKDIDSGEYVLLSEDYSSGFFSVTSDANGNDILFNGSFETNTIIQIMDGEFLELRRGIAVKYDDFYPSYSIKLDKEGIMIKVGNEIEEGEYKIEGEDGFYSIYSDSRQSDIIANGSIKGSGYIEVKNGQYLELRRCKISEKTE